jgi:hypothetical protein
MNYSKLYEYFTKLPPEVKIKTLSKLLNEKADSDVYAETFKLLTQAEYTSPFSSFNQDSESLEESLVGEMTQEESLEALEFDIVLLLQDFAYEMADQSNVSFEDIDIVIEEARDLTHLQLTINCASQSDLSFLTERLFLRKGFIFRTEEVKEQEGGKVQSIIKVYGVMPEDICLN